MDLEVYQSNKGSNSVYIFYLSEIKLAKLRPKLKKITSVAPCHSCLIKLSTPCCSIEYFDACIEML